MTLKPHTWTIRVAPEQINPVTFNDYAEFVDRLMDIILKHYGEPHDLTVEYFKTPKELDDRA